LEANNQAHRTSKPSPSSSLLTGLLRDTNGIRYTPTHAVKKGKRYRYYTSQAVIQQRGDQPRVARYPAGELEALVTTQIHEFLKTSHKYLHENEASPDTELAVQRAKDLAAKWPTLGISKQQVFVRSVVKTVTLGQKNLWIELDKLKVIATLLGHGLVELPAPGNRKAVEIKLNVDFQPVRRGVELQIYAPDNHSAQNKPVPSLINAIARARIWYEQMVSGEINGVEQLARQSGFECRYVRKILQSAVLSPKIVEAMLSGRQVRHITVKSLRGNLPLDWQKQEQLFLPQPFVRTPNQGHFLKSRIREIYTKRPETSPGIFKRSKNVVQK
jgi:hypothetical protein